jgi:lipoate---protein ligase
MRYLSLSLPALEENLALDEALLLEAEEGNGSGCLRLWEWPSPAIVLGAAGRLAEDVNESACLADGVPVFRRSSGGGTVLLGRGCLLFSLILEYRRTQELSEILSSYRFILGHIADALSPLQAGLEFAGTSDLAMGGRKVSGNSQQRKRRYLLHHGTLLYDFAMEPVERYLYLPGRQPEYRRGRTHREFLTNLVVGREELIQRLRNCWDADDLAESWPQDQVRRLVAEKYARAEWIRRR